MAEAAPPPKRRKVRKGTHTCWECKRRKVRCIFAAPQDTVCTGCVKRCLRCVSQEFPEETTSPAAKSRLVGERIVRVEEMIRQLTQGNLSLSPDNAGSAAAVSTPGASVAAAASTSGRVAAAVAPAALAPTALTPQSMSATPATSSTASSVGGCAVTGETLAADLLAAYPSQADQERIVDGGAKAYRFMQLVFRSERELHDGFWPVERLRIRHTPQSSPVHIAWQMLHLAMILQMGEPGSFAGLSEPAAVIMDRLADTAIARVSRCDALLDGSDGLLCVMLESVYMGNAGYLRRAWLTWRRAISLAQLMCLPRQNRHAAQRHAPNPVAGPDGPVNGQYLWYRLVSVDRFMCLLLGLETSLDAPLMPPAAVGNDTPMSCLEHRLYEIAGYILGRNDREPLPDDYAATQRIDAEMQQVAATLPSRWWLPPNLKPSLDSDDDIWELLRFKNQVFYYNLLNQLHLPYMMRLSNLGSENAHRYEYSRTACVSASREVLSRYIALRSHNQIACCCRFAEFFALMASLTLMLVHIDGHIAHEKVTCIADSSNTITAASPAPLPNLFAHQRLSDRAMTEETLESMERVGRLNGDAVCESGVDLLRQLLAIEATAAASGPNHSLESCPDDVRSAGQLRFTVPYIGIITIDRNGAITKEAALTKDAVSAFSYAAPSQPTALPASPRLDSPDGSICAPVCATTAEPHTTCIDFRLPQQSFSADLQDPLAAPITPLTTPPSLDAQALNTFTQNPLPGPTAGIDQWAFQGVDMAFFDSLMRGSIDPQYR